MPLQRKHSLRSYQMSFLEARVHVRHGLFVWWNVPADPGATMQVPSLMYFYVSVHPVFQVLPFLLFFLRTAHNFHHTYINSLYPIHISGWLPDSKNTCHGLQSIMHHHRWINMFQAIQSYYYPNGLSAHRAAINRRAESAPLPALSFFVAHRRAL